MNILKFRAWNKVDNCWVEDVCAKHCFKGKTATIRSKDLIFEPCTGLKDKNGKEIYSGDIVRTTDRVTVKGLIFPIGVVEFKQRAFWICNVPSERPDFTHNETLLQYWETDLEVIGNVHENGELIGGEE